MSSDSVAGLEVDNYNPIDVQQGHKRYWPVQTTFTGFETEKFLTGWTCKIPVKEIKFQFFPVSEAHNSLIESRREALKSKND